MLFDHQHQVKFE